ncbi:16S rRNA (uracil(1498)-N(3))-methyltransferase [Leyella stercorea]|uniref:16S rRNA (uracil(1498)-N(3))-methyltransferase n=1 Tax=Leyella stercorea TaxID=363265 RepID=UPI00242B2201|nr:16S rRNA (uracil(1498)-N(3))-methyltransferase [Leyella stercorea]
MKEIRYFYVPNAASVGELPEEEAKHAVRVLRLQSGDRMVLVDGEGGLFDAEVSVASGKHCLYNILETLPYEREWRGRISLAIAPTKMMDRIEWMAEKATEVGFDEISFLDCKFSERKTLRTDRVERIVVSAMKQSHKACKPMVNEMCGFREFVAMEREGRKFIAHCYEEVARRDLFDELSAMDAETPVTVLVGPEGDFSIDEVRLAMEHGYESISLGRSRLRTETAGLSAVMMANLSKRRG